VRGGAAGRVHDAAPGTVPNLDQTQAKNRLKRTAGLLCCHPCLDFGFLLPLTGSLSIELLVLCFAFGEALLAEGFRFFLLFALLLLGCLLLCFLLSTTFCLFALTF
jgi:hypothetical protein